MDDARLMIVEDNEEIAQMLVLFLGSRGYKVSLAPDGATALQLVRESLPSLILLDVGLPDIDGYELLRQLRQAVRTRYIPVIFLTQRNKKADRITGLTLGADDFISKPFDLEELYLRIQNAIARAAREKTSDPSTGLPTGTATREAIEASRGRPGRVVTEYRLRHLNDFRDQYAALATADLLRYLALLLNGTLNAHGGPDDFVGQLDEETFVVITAADRAEPIRRTIVERFAADAVQHYALGQRVGDQVKVRNTQGQEVILPLLRLDTSRLS